MRNSARDGRMMHRLRKSLTQFIAAVILAVILLTELGPRAAARTPRGDGLRHGRCSLVIDGRSYIAGRCEYAILQHGSFVITGPAKNDYFAYVMIDDEGAEGFWSGERGATHASIPLGNLARSKSLIRNSVSGSRCRPAPPAQPPTGYHKWVVGSGERAGTEPEIRSCANFGSDSNACWMNSHTRICLRR